MVIEAAEEALEASGRRARSDRNGRSLPKIDALRGSLHAELKRCGKPSCRCERGALHGPYWSLRWREDGRQCRRYVRPDDLDQVGAGLDAWRRLHPPARSLRERLRELRRLVRQIDALEV